MNHPPYHLRPNKAVDRFRLVEILRAYARGGSLSDYVYYGFGGPFLEDFRLLAEFFPELKMVSFEGDESTFRRQRFHRPHNKLVLRNVEFKAFLQEYTGESKGVFWLDYTKFNRACFDEFMLLLRKAQIGSVVKVTVRAEADAFPSVTPPDLLPQAQLEVAKQAWVEKFRTDFGDLVPQGITFQSFRPGKIAKVIQDMFQIAAETAFPAEANDRHFQVVDSCSYKDGVRMYCLTGIVCRPEQQTELPRVFKKIGFANLDWREPGSIDVPLLSTKERLHLEPHLPRGGKSGKALHRRLGYLIGSDRAETEERLTQYADFNRYLPYFIKATP